MISEDEHDPKTPAGHTTPPSNPALVPGDSPASHDARVQEMKAGAAPLVRIISVAARTPPGRSGHDAIATVPFLTVAAVRWSKVTVGDTIGRLVHLLQERGGIWLAKHTTATLTWTVSSAGPTGDDSTRTTTPPWLRLDATFSGAWSGRFSLAGSAPRLAANLWCVATSPLVGILPDEAADKALPPTADTTPVAWKSFTEALDNSVHTTTHPPQVVRDLVLQSAWPGADQLRKRDQRRN